MLKGINYSDLFDCTFNRWQPKIGDPTVMGWVTVVVYLMTFILSLLVLRRIDPSRRMMRLFWGLLTLMMLFLAFNKQADLQSFFTASARCVAKLQGWYENRRPFQYKVVMTMGAVALATGTLFLWALRRDLKRNWLALIGMTFVFGFILVRAVGWHDFDQIINRRIVNIRLNWVMELSGLFLISLNALFLLRSRRITVPRRRRRVRAQANTVGDAHSYRRRHKRRKEPSPEAYRRDH